LGISASTIAVAATVEAVMVVMRSMNARRSM